MYQAGYLHRDISIGNILIVQTPTPGKKFDLGIEEVLQKITPPSPSASAALLQKRAECKNIIRTAGQKVGHPSWTTPADNRQGDYHGL